MRKFLTLMGGQLQLLDVEKLKYALKYSFTGKVLFNWIYRKHDISWWDSLLGHIFSYSVVKIYRNVLCQQQKHQHNPP